MQVELGTGEERLRMAFAHSIVSGMAQTIMVDVPEGAETAQLSGAAVLFAGIRNFTSLAEKLG